MSSLTRKVGSKPDVRVNDLPGPPQTTDLEPPDINAELQQWTRCAAVQYLSNATYRAVKRKIREVAGTAPGVDGKPTGTFTSFFSF